MNNRNGYLMNRDRKILVFVDRYRAVTEELIQKSIFTGADNTANTARVMRRLLRRGYLRKFTYAPGKSYYVLTRSGCRIVGTSNRPSRPFTEQSLPVAFAIAWYCVRNGVQRFTDRQFRERYPELWKPGLRSSSYYLVETIQGLKLGMFLVDRGGSPRRIKSKLRRISMQRASLPAFDALITAKRFRVTILTGLPAQQANIRRQLANCRLGRIEVEVAVVPELGELLTQR